MTPVERDRGSHFFDDVLQESNVPRIGVEVKEAQEQGKAPVTACFADKPDGFALKRGVVAVAMAKVILEIIFYSQD